MLASGSNQQGLCLATRYNLQEAHRMALTPSDSERATIIISAAGPTKCCLHLCRKAPDLEADQLLSPPKVSPILYRDLS
jgi:hypothetical protein